MRGIGAILTLASGLALTPGCFSPMTTRLPNLVHGDPRIERRAALTKDPFPDEKLGPDVTYRPPDYLVTRSEPRQVKDKFFTWAWPQLTPVGRDPLTPFGWIGPPWMAAPGTPAFTPFVATVPVPAGPVSVPCVAGGYPVPVAYPMHGGGSAPLTVVLPRSGF